MAIASRFARLIEALIGRPTGHLPTWGLQELEEVFDAMGWRRSVLGATGTLLELVGADLGLGRTSLDDDEYRTDLLIQILINTSKGELERMQTMMRMVPGRVQSWVDVLPPACISLQLLGTILRPGTWTRFRSAVAAGVGCEVVATATLVPMRFGSLTVDPRTPAGRIASLWTIAGVVVGGPGAGAFVLTGDKTALYDVGDPVSVEGSVADDGDYEITGATFGAGVTQVDVAEAVVGPASGAILYGKATEAGRMASIL